MSTINLGYENGGSYSIMILKTIPKFGNDDGNWSKMKDLLYVCFDILCEGLFPYREPKTSAYRRA